MKKIQASLQLCELWLYSENLNKYRKHGHHSPQPLRLDEPKKSSSFFSLQGYNLVSIEWERGRSQQKLINEERCQKNILTKSCCCPFVSRTKIYLMTLKWCFIIKITSSLINFLFAAINLLKFKPFLRIFFCLALFAFWRTHICLFLRAWRSCVSWELTLP